MLTDLLSQFRIKFNSSLTDSMRNSEVTHAVNYDKTNDTNVTAKL